MYLVDKIDDEQRVKEAAVLEPPSGPGFSPEQVKGAVSMEIWGSSFSDPGPDYNLFKLFGPAGKQIATKRMEGY